MAIRRRISVSLPEILLRQIDEEIERTHIGRNEFIRESVEYYILECKRRSFHEQLAVGYRMMGALNLTLAQEDEDDASLSDYERKLSEGD